MPPGEVVCLLCGTVVGDIRQGSFTHHAGCERPVRFKGRLPRCCRCGGSLYFDPAISSNPFAGTAEMIATGRMEV